MRFDLDKAFGIHQQALILRSRRAEVLASNIANADTPNYKARDIDFQALLQAAQNQANTSVAAQADSTSPGDAFFGIPFELKYRQPFQPSLDGNTVDSEYEKAEFSRNAVQFQVSLNFMDGRIKQLKRALSGE